MALTLHGFAASHRLPGTVAELRADETPNQMFPEGDNLADVRGPGRVEAETAELGLAEATSKEVVTEPVDGFIHLATTNPTKNEFARLYVK